MKLLYKPFGTIMSVLGGLVASVIFKRLWKLMSHQDVAPTATQEGRSWREVLAAAALRGAIFGLVTAAIDRGGAVGFTRATGAWPGKKEPSSGKRNRAPSAIRAKPIEGRATLLDLVSSARLAAYSQAGCVRATRMAMFSMPR